MWRERRRACFLVYAEERINFPLFCGHLHSKVPQRQRERGFLWMLWVEVSDTVTMLLANVHITLTWYSMMNTIDEHDTTTNESLTRLERTRATDEKARAVATSYPVCFPCPP